MGKLSVLASSLASRALWQDPSSVTVAGQTIMDKLGVSAEEFHYEFFVSSGGYSYLRDDLPWRGLTEQLLGYRVLHGSKQVMPSTHIVANSTQGTEIIFYINPEIRPTRLKKLGKHSGQATVKWGIYADVDNYVGMTVAQVFRQLCEVWNIPSSVSCHLNGRAVSYSHVLAKGDHLEFIRKKF